jgi:hypothetical protein
MIGVFRLLSICRQFLLGLARLDRNGSSRESVSILYIPAFKVTPEAETAIAAPGPPSLRKFTVSSHPDFKWLAFRKAHTDPKDIQSL